jgi:serine/threonine protein phosphatase PrpC
MPTLYEGLQPLYAKAEVSCFKLKGEDFHSRHADVHVSATVAGESVHATCAMFAVLDGHGGKAAAEFASKQARTLQASSLVSERLYTIQWSFSF